MGKNKLYIIIWISIVILITIFLYATKSEIISNIIKPAPINEDELYNPSIDWNFTIDQINKQNDIFIDKDDSEFFVPDTVESGISIVHINKDKSMILNDGAVIPNNTIMDDGTIYKDWYIISHQVTDHDSYMADDYFLLNEIDVLLFDEVGWIKNIMLKSWDILSLNEIETKGYVYNASKKIIERWEKLNNKKIEIWVNNEYRVNKKKSITKYKILKEIESFGKIKKTEDETLIVSEDKNYIYFKTLKNIENILIIDDIYKRAYDEELILEAGINIKIAKKVLYEALYHDIIPKNVLFTLQTYKIIEDDNIIISKEYNIVKKIKWKEIIKPLAETPFININEK